MGDAICLENIGLYLRKERESRHISLEEFSRRIRMGSCFIKALEENNYAFFSKPEFFLWFLKRYTRQLGIDTEDVTRPLAIQYGPKLQKEFYLNSSNESELIMSNDEKSGKEPSETTLSQKNKDPIREKLPPRDSLEEFKILLGEEFLPKNQHELDLLMKSIQETVKKKGQNWVKRNRGTLLRQWEYIRSLL